MTDWVPRNIDGHGPRYVALVDELEGDIAAGRISPGARLLPQREMAERLGLSVGTISKAYAEAGQRGLIAGEVGRGTFVTARRSGGNDGVNSKRMAGVNFALNVPPSTGEEAVIARVLAEIASEDDTSHLLGYLPHQGLPRHREAVATWICDHGFVVDPDHLFVTHGAQHAISIALAMLVPHGGTVLTENVTYSGMFALATQRNYRLEGVALDRYGLVPKALDAAFADTGAKALYCMPTLQTPTSITLSSERRHEIAEVLRRHDAYVVEDDAYAFLFDAPPTPISALAPERSFYAVSFAKCLAPGLRIGALVAPNAFRDRIINAIRATSWMAAPIMAEVVARLIRSGMLSEQARRKRLCAARRVSLVHSLMDSWLPDNVNHPSFHLWLPLPAGRTISGLMTQAAHEGITLVPPHALHPHAAEAHGVRLCLGAPDSEKELADAILAIRRILETPEPMSLV